MILRFADPKTEEMFRTGSYPGWDEGLCRVARRKLDLLNVARKVTDLKAPPGNKLHPLKKKRKGHSAIWINGKYRICFRFEGVNAVDVEIVDYHDED